MKLSLLFIFVLSATTGLCQSDSVNISSPSAESKLNELLAETKKVKTLVEEQGKFVKSYMSKDSLVYINLFNDYVKAQSEFDEWIEFYVLEFNSSMKNKKYEINTAKLESIINRSISSAHIFVTRVNENKSYSLKGVPIATIIAGADYIKKAYDLYKEFRNSKREHRNAIVKELEDKLQKYKIKSFSEL
jgi:hypothetical protein